MLEERLSAAQLNTAELKRHNGELVERNGTAQRELTQERLARSQVELQLKNSQQVSCRTIFGVLRLERRSCPIFSCDSITFS